MTFFGGTGSPTGGVVTSVNGRSGAVTLSASDVGLSAVQNLSEDDITNPLYALVDELETAAAARKTDDYLLSRSNHTGTDSAANVALASGETLEAAIASIRSRLASVGAIAPVNTVAPAAPTGTVTVGSTLTAQVGTWSPAADSYEYTWYRVPATGGVFTATGGTASTYVLQPADRDHYIACDIVGVESTTPPVTKSDPVRSALTAIITGTLPTNTVAPAVTPSGSQAEGTLLTSTTGTWADATGATYTYQWFTGSGVSAVEIPGATASTFTLTNAQVGLSVICRVLATTSVGPAASPATSNAITVTGVAQSWLNVTVPAWPANIYINIAATITEGTWTLSGAAVTPSVIHNFYKNGLTTPYRSGNTGLTHTPKSTPQDNLVVGDSLVIESVPTYQGTTYPAVRSAAKVLEAASATLAVTLTAEGSAGYVWVQGQAITSATPVAATGGTAPYRYSIAGLPSGITLSGASADQLPLIGTPGATSPLTAYTVVVTDAVGASVNIAFNAQVNQQSVSQLTAMLIPVPLNVDPHASQTYSLGTTVTIGGLIRVTPSGIRQIHRVRFADGGTNRCEFVHIDQSTGPVHKIFAQDEVWWCFDAAPVAGEWPAAGNGSGVDNSFLIMQTHTDRGGDTQPPVALYIRPRNNDMRWGSSWSTATSGGQEGITRPISGTTETMMTVGNRYGYIVAQRAGYLASHNPRLRVWRRVNGGAFTQLCDSTALNTYNGPAGSGFGDYIRKGPYAAALAGLPATLAIEMSRLYAEKGTNLFAKCEARLVGLGS